MPAPHQQSSRQIQDSVTSLTVADTITAAADFFARRNGVYSAFVEKQGPTHLVLRGQGGEELVIAARATDAGTVVTGSSYLFDQQIARFFTSLPPVLPTAAPAAVTEGAVAALPAATNS
jgi:hypothetical protein